MIRHLGTKLEIGGYKYMKYKTLIPGNATLKKIPF